MSEEFTARQSCNDRWLKLETRASLWGEQALAVVQALLKEANAQNVQEVGAQVGQSALWGYGCGVGCRAAGSDRETA
jgi:hypothetical protein